MIRVDETDPVGEIELSFPYRDVVIKRNMDVKDTYDLQKEIGRGKFGTVYRCKDKQIGLELAAKFVPVARKEDRRNVEREVDIMKKLQHPRLIQLYDAYDCGKTMIVILELIEGGELFERVIDDDFVLTEKSCTAFMRQICEGVEYVHRQNILHLDMKPENILCLTKTGNRIKIIDFGLARKFDPDKKLQVLFGTPEFVAPEVVNFDQIGFGTDMWSVGVICYVLLSGLSPFMGETDVETMANVTIAKYDFEDEAFENISNDAKDFMKKLLIKDKKQRMTATECIEHAWLRRKPPAHTPSPPTPPALTSGLDMTKDNLRMFVERWALHPNSPYLFDVSAHMISPLMLTAGVKLTSSQHSLRGMSPSPCGSLTSSPDSVIEHDTIGHSLHNTNHSNIQDDSIFTHFTFNPPPITHNAHVHQEHLQSFERRASDSSFVVRKTDIAERINLAEEIRKLSDKLFKMSTLPDFTTLSSSSTNSMETTELKSQSSIPLKTNNLTTPYRPKFDTTSTKHQTKQNEASSNNSAPWRRTKFRITGLNRDVPLSSYSKSSTFSEFNNGFSNTQVSSEKWSSTSSNTNSAVGTKDLLLKLLDKWDDAQEEPVRSSNGRHKSISAEWSEIESLGQRTISSLNTFFQSRATTKKAHPFMAANGVK